MKEIPISQLPRECFENTAAMQLQGRIRLPASCEGRLSRCLRIFHHGAADPKTIQLNIDCQSLPNFLRLAAQRPHVHVTLGENVTGSYNFGFFGPGTVHVGKNTSSNGMEAMICENGVLKIGDDCMFAAHIMLHVGDNHAVFDMSTGEVINLRSSPYIHIEDHVWVGQRSSILGDVTVGRGSVIAAYSVLTKSPPPFSLAAGNPAVIRKNNISWTRSYRGGERMDIAARLQKSDGQAMMNTTHLQVSDYDQLVHNAAEDFVAIAYHAILGRAPDSDGAQHYTRQLKEKANFSEIIASLWQSEEFLKNYTTPSNSTDNLNQNLTYTPASILQSQIKKFAEDFAEVAYRGILSRLPDESGKKTYTAKIAATGDVAAVLHNLLRSDEFNKKFWRFHDYRDWLNKNISTDIDVLRAPNKKVAAIFVPDQIWVVSVLTLAKNLEQAGYFPILVKPQNSVIAINSEYYTYPVFNLEQLENSATDKFLLDRVYIHSFGWPDAGKRVVEIFKNATLCHYADGFSNELTSSIDTQTVREVVHFGYCPTDLSIKTITLPYQQWLTVHRNQLPHGLRAPLPPVDAQLLVCLRYYGLGPYAFDLQHILRLVWETTKPLVRPSISIVIKTDARHPQLVNDVLAYFRQQHDGPVSSLSDSIGHLATHPLESIMETGALERVEHYVVFDSSVSYILLHHPMLRPGATVLLGAAVEALDESVRPHARPIEKKTEYYAHALEKDGAQVEKIGHSMYLLRQGRQSGAGLLSRLKSCLRRMLKALRS